MTETRRRKKSTHPLAHRIPALRYLEDYVHRDIYGFTDFKFLRYCMKTRRNILISGDTQTGKTKMINAFGAEMGLPVVTLNANGGIDPNTIMGTHIPSVEDARVWEWVWSELVEVVMHGGILFLDEVNFMHPRVSAVFHSLTDERRQIVALERGNEVIDAHPDLLVVAAYNHGYEGTRPLNQAFKGRFVPVEFDYSPAIEEDLFCMPVTAVIAEKLRSARSEGVLRTPVGTGVMVCFEQFAGDIGPTAAIESLVLRFDPEERMAVREVLKLHEATIVEEARDMTMEEDDEETTTDEKVTFQTDESPT